MSRERNNMAIMGGTGNFVVFAYAVGEREGNQGLAAGQQRTAGARGGIELYRTDDENEARKLTLEGGIEYHGVVYVATHYADSTAAAVKDHVQQVSGTLRKDDPSL